jgi:hypothetical protein
MCMMNPIELLAQVKKLVFQEETMPEPGYTLEDGTKIMVSALEVGGIVTLEDGSPAPAGEHTLADGTEIVLAEGGVIAEIKPKEVEEPEVSVEIESGKDMEKKDEEEKAKMAAKFSEIENRIAASEQSFSALQSDYNTMKAAFAKQSEAMQGLIQLVDTLVNVPSQAPAEVPNNFKKVSVESKADKIKSYSQFVSQFKNK